MRREEVRVSNLEENVENENLTQHFSILKYRLIF